MFNNKFSFPLTHLLLLGGCLLFLIACGASAEPPIEATPTPAQFVPISSPTATPLPPVEVPTSPTVLAVATEAASIASILKETLNKTATAMASESQEVTPTPAEEVEMQTYVDRELSLAFDVPFNWKVDGTPGAFGEVHAPSETAEGQAILHYSVLKPESNTLELAVEEIKSGAFGPYLTTTEPTFLGPFEGLLVTLAPNEIEGGPSQLWLMMAPPGQAVVFTPKSDPALAEPILATLRGIR